MEIPLKHGRNLRLPPEEYAKKLWDWTPLNKCFERNIRVTDVDGFVEVNYHFLYLEGKSRSANLSGGQKIALERLAKLPQFTVVVFWGDPPDLHTVTEWEVLGKNKYKGGFEEFSKFIHEWFIWADNNDIRDKF